MASEIVESLKKKIGEIPLEDIYEIADLINRRIEELEEDMDELEDDECEELFDEDTFSEDEEAVAEIKEELGI